jgi:hypothetical protein
LKAQPPFDFLIFESFDMKRLFFFVVTVLLFSDLEAQIKSENSRGFYAGIGWHRIFFSKSTIRFRDTKTGNYDFTLHKVKARDDKDLRIGKGHTAPHFTVLAGYNFSNTTGIELHYDHAKYIVVQDQKVRIKGRIDETIMDRDTVLSKDFLQYEHTHGANHVMVNLVKAQPVGNNSFLIKPGAGLVVPHSDNKLMGKNGPGKYHIAGFIVALDIGWRYNLMKHAFIQVSLKGAYALYSDVLLYGGGRARQHWFSLQPIIVAGYSKF